MAINVTLGEAQTQEKDFPKLVKFTYKEGNYVILLMTGNSKGVVLSVNILSNIDCKDKVGNLWDVKGELSGKFTDYNEPITIQNK